jgi:hypothetical protein
LQLLSELGAEDHREGLDVDQEVLASRPPGALGRQTSSSNDIMHVGMVAQSAGPRMEHPYHPDPAADEPRIQRQCLQGLGGAPKEEVVEGLLVTTGQGSEFRRER